MTVWRRYSDFEWLHKRLSTVYPAAIIPLFPEKRCVQTFRACLPVPRARVCTRSFAHEPPPPSTHPELPAACHAPLSNPVRRGCSVMGNNDDTFVVQRMKSLEAYMDKVRASCVYTRNHGGG